MTDQSVLKHIEELVAEEQRLWDKGAETNAEERKRRDQIQVELDQCWDLLRQRRAREEFDQDPDQARLRDADIVENYVE